jgi:hypothetical protein
MRSFREHISEQAKPIEWKYKRVRGGYSTKGEYKSSDGRFTITHKRMPWGVGGSEVDHYMLFDKYSRGKTEGSNLDRIKKDAETMRQESP